MSKPKRKIIYKWIRGYPFFKYNEETAQLHCKLCDVYMKGPSKSSVALHLSSKRHIYNSKDTKDFYFDLIVFLVTCNIPWNKMNDPQFRIFFEKYLCCCTTRKLPEEKILRRYHLDILYKRTVKQIREKILGTDLWISVDETEIEGTSCVANVVIRQLTEDACHKVYLIGRKILDKEKGDSIADFVVNQLRFVLEDSYNEHLNNVLLLTTDSTTNMLNAGKILKDIFPNLLHITCVAQGLHKVVEHIRSQYKNVDQFIRSVKKIFSQSHVVRIFNQTCPSIPLPPKSIGTKLGVWLKDVLYYAEHLDDIIKIIYELEMIESVDLIESESLFECRNLKVDLDYIKENYEYLSEAIVKLQKPRLTLLESFVILDNLKAILDWNGSSTVSLKLEEILDGIPDYDMLRGYADVIAKSECQGSFIQSYQYAPITSMDIEGLITMYTDKWNSIDKRKSLQGDNLAKIMTILYYYREDDADIMNTDIDFLSVMKVDDAEG